MFRELSRAVKSNRRPVISAAAARERYEPLVDVLAERLALEFGVMWHRAEAEPAKGRRAFRTTRWVIDEPLTRFPEWERRLDATVGQVFDVVGLGTPLATLGAVFDGLDVESAAGAPHVAAQQIEPDPIVWLDGDKPLFLPMLWSVRDRIGGDINITVRDDSTSLWVSATVKPR